VVTALFRRCVVEQDQRNITKITKPMMGLNSFHSSKVAIDGIKTNHVIIKRQLFEENIPPYKQFMTIVSTNRYQTRMYF